MELSVHAFVTLDGVMQGPGAPDEDRSGGFDRGGWLVPFADMDMGRVVDGWFDHAGAILLGRTTYEMMRDYWTRVTDPDDVVARALNTHQKYVVSSTLPDEDLWDHTTVLRGDVLDRIRELKATEGRELQVHGSWRLARTLHDAGLVDVVRLLQFPCVVGAGKRLFEPGAAAAAYTVSDVTTTSTGATAMTLRPADFRVGEFVVEDGAEAVAG